MRVVVYALAAVFVLAAVLRRRRRGAGPLRLPAALRRRGAGIPLGDTGIIAAREVRERLRGRTFRFVTLVVLAIVGAAIVIPTLHSTTSGPEVVGIVAGTPSPSGAVLAEAKHLGLPVRTVTEPDLSTARSALHAGRIDLAVDGYRSLVLDKPLAAGDTSRTAQFVRSLSTVLGLERAFRDAGLSPAQASVIARASAVPVTSLTSAETKSGSPVRSTSLIGIILIFIMLTQYNTWTLMGVMEEKSSRVVEVLLATVRPIQLLAGKVLGIGLVALLQAALIVSFALVLAGAVGSNLLQGTAPLVVVSTLVWLVLGYAFYCWVYAAAGSLAERQDQIQSLAIPLGAPIIAGYVISLTVASSGNPALWFKVLAFFPPTAPFAMPVLVGLGQTSWWAFVLSALVSVAGTVLVARAAAGVYRRAVLRSGRRVKLGEVLGRRLGGGS